MTLRDMTPEGVLGLSRDEKNRLCLELMGVAPRTNWMCLPCLDGGEGEIGSCPRCNLQVQVVRSGAPDFCSDLNLAAKLPEAVRKWTGDGCCVLRLQEMHTGLRWLAFYGDLAQSRRDDRAEAEVDAALMAVAVYGRK